ncbi:MAG: ANTAR domain-containing protein [Roseburia sp.]|nr:ANTAR domain-containing protein [Roseburia sp.]
MNVIIVFPKLENGKNIRRILLQSGFDVKAVCTTGAQALQSIQELSSGIVVCTYRFADMMYEELHEYLPPGFEMLLVASADVCDGRERQDIVCLKMPLKIHELVQTMEMMAGELSRRNRRRRKIPKKRSKEEEALLREAKELLMERNQMTEEQAHRYIQKRSMDNGTGMVETAEMILSLMNG